LRYAANHKQGAKARILKAAERGFRRSGLAVGVDGLAREAGVTLGAFCGHFRAKMEAFVAVVRASAKHCASA
jgi:TetR/AcrR family transcriptional regulator, transcriptional repressor for nem operon